MLFPVSLDDQVPDDVTAVNALQADFQCRSADRGCYDDDPQTVGVSCDHEAAILPVVVDVLHEDPVPSFVSSSRIPVSDPTLVFIIPETTKTVPVNIYSTCLSGICTCIHLIGSEQAQLKPCRAAQFLFGPTRLETVDDDEALFLWEGLVNGFAIVDDDCQASYFCQNYDSILEPTAYAEMSKLLHEDILEGKVSRVTSASRCVHSLGAVWKSNGKLRPITDCSRPDGLSINNYMSDTFNSFSYNSVQDAVDLLSPGDYTAVVDIASAYRSVNVRSDQVGFQGLTWDFGSGPESLQDHRLCFGLRCAPNIFDCLSQFVVCIANSRGACRVVNYLDDFLVIGDSPESCLNQRDIITDVLSLLGFQVSWKKVTDPATCTTFLGINIDSVAYELSLPMEKVTKLKDLASKILDRGHSTKKELECLGGLVSYCSYVVRGGRTFSRRIFDLSASYTRRSNHIPLDDAIKEDLRWWLAFCGVFNGKACIIRDRHPIPLYSDASFEGFGAWLGKDWFYGCWSSGQPLPLPPGCGHYEAPPDIELSRNINVFELWPLVVGLRRWGRLFTNAKLHFITDNMQVLAMINTGRSSNKLCMSWLREMFWMCFLWNVDICASYIKSEDNVLADALSRLPYHGVLKKCEYLLSDTNMCCSSIPRTFVGSTTTPSAAAAGCSPCGDHQELSPFTDQLLF